MRELLLTVSRFCLQTTLGEFLDQFLSVIFDPDLLLHEKSGAPYMYILPRYGTGRNSDT